MKTDLSVMDEVVRRGCPDEIDRQRRAAKAIAYARGDFRGYRYKLPDQTGRQFTDRSSRFMQMAVDKLTAHLYRDNPIRTIKGHEAATDWLQDIYTKNSVWAKWQAADKLSMCAEVAAWQVAGTEDPKNPIKIHLWDSAHFNVFKDADDPTKAQAVVTRDRVGKKERQTLYTADVINTYMSLDEATEEGHAMELVSSEPNPYGVLPFSFTHFEFPILDFWSGSPGDQMAEVNDYIIYRLTDLADAIKYLMYPRIVVTGTDEKPPVPFAPGQIWAPKPKVDPMSGASTTVSATTVSPPLDFIAQTWLDIEKYADHSMDMAGIPTSAVRMSQSAARSGQSIASEQLPIVNWARSRQRPFASYEANLARLVLQVAVAHLGSNGLPVADLQAALEDFNLSIQWPKPHSAIPGPEQDRADAYAVANGYASKVMVLQEREGCTREEAVAKLAQVAVDNAEVEEILGPEVAEGIDPTKDTTPDAGDKAITPDEMDEEEAA